MIGFDEMKLVTEVYTDDELSQSVKTSETVRDVFCRVKSISQSEFFEAGRIGLTPAYKAVLATALDYDGEQIAEYNGERFAVYRTYETEMGELELYLSRETGVH